MIIYLGYAIDFNNEDNKEIIDNIKRVIKRKGHKIYDPFLAWSSSSFDNITDTEAKTIRDVNTQAMLSAGIAVFFWSPSSSSSVGVPIELEICRNNHKQVIFLTKKEDYVKSVYLRTVLEYQTVIFIDEDDYGKWEEILCKNL